MKFLKNISLIYFVVCTQKCHRFLWLTSVTCHITVQVLHGVLTPPPTTTTTTNSESNPREKEMGGFTFPSFKLYYQTTTIKTV